MKSYRNTKKNQSGGQKKGFITSKKNCSVSVLVTKKNNTTGFVAVINIAQLLNVRNPIKRDVNEKTRGVSQLQKKCTSHLKQKSKTTTEEKVKKDNILKFINREHKFICNKLGLYLLAYINSLS